VETRQEGRVRAVSSGHELNWRVGRVARSGLPTHRDLARSTSQIPIDPNGNLTTKTEGTDVWTYTWNAENQLTKVEKNAVEQARFAYDPRGRRVEKVAGGVTTSYTYDGEDIVREVRGGLTLKYVHSRWVDEQLAAEDSATVTYFHADGLGSIVRTTDAAGTAASARQYDAWGRLQAGSDGSGPAFIGREWDPEVGLYYYRARYYAPEVGRFISQDPLGMADGVNVYAYVRNNPATNADPSGLFTMDPSCKNWGCQGMGGGGPGGPPPSWYDMGEVIQRGAEDWCRNLHRVTDPKLRACIKKSCETGKIKCKEKCDSDAGGWARKKILFVKSRTANLCPNNWPDWTPTGYAGDTVIHEWAHGCGWDHGGGGGIP